jgi:hypothetical protein
MSTYIKAAHYFAHASMGNFWSAFQKHRVATDFCDIRDDGFNTIILLVPWGQFQPDPDNPDCDPELLGRLEFLLNAAELAELKVILRIGYLWDTFPCRSRTYQRLHHLSTDKKHQKMWLAFNRKIVGLAEGSASYLYSFLSWEDLYWPSILPIIDYIEDYDPHQRAQQLGFQDYLAEHFDIASLNASYKLNIDNFSQAGMPTIDDPLFGEALQYFDQQIVPLIFSLTRPLYHDLRYEHRVDKNVIKLPGGGKLKYGIDNRLANAGQPIVYYHLNVGTEYQTSQISAETAVGQLNNFLQAQQLNYGDKVFIDQFNFMVNNPKYPNFMTLSYQETLSFLAHCAPALQQYTSGYGIWGYLDWCNDKIYNGAFELGLKHWQLKNDYQFEQSSKGNSLILFSGALLVQRMLSGRNLTDPVISIECEALTNAELKIMQNDAAIDIQYINVLDGRRRYEFPMANGKFQRLRIKVVTGDIRIFSIQYFSNTMSNGMRGRDKQTNRVVDAIKELNLAL